MRMHIKSILWCYVFALFVLSGLLCGPTGEVLEHRSIDMSDLLRLEFNSRDAVRFNKKRANHSKVLTYKHKDGYDLHRSGYSKRKYDFAGIMVHWSSTLSEESCYRVLKNRNLSSHFGVGQDVIYQWLDFEFAAWHGGVANRRYIGIDMCTTPKTKYKKRLEKLGHTVEEKVNTSGRGPKKVLTPDPLIVRATQELILDLCSIFDIPLRVPRGADGFAETGPYWHGTFSKDVIRAGGFEGIIFHSHSSTKKKDCACWANELFDSLFA
jgi:hypothetical protein